MPPSSTVFARRKAQEKNYSSLASIGYYSGTYEECSLRKRGSLAMCLATRSAEFRMAAVMFANHAGKNLANPYSLVK